MSNETPSWHFDAVLRFNAGTSGRGSPFHSLGVNMSVTRTPKAKAANAAPKWWQKLTAPQATIIAALFALVSSGLAGLAGYFKGNENAPFREVAAAAITSRLQARIPARPGYRTAFFTRLGVGVLVPLGWQIDSAAYDFGGSDIDLIRHYDMAANSISEGIKLAVRPVQGNYVHSPELEEQNQLDVFRKLDPNAKLTRAAISGQSATRFSYKQSTGNRVGSIDRYWLRLASRVKLELIVFTNLGDSRPDFERETADVLGSLVLDRETIDRNAKATSK